MAGLGVDGGIGFGIDGEMLEGMEVDEVDQIIPDYVDLADLEDDEDEGDIDMTPEKRRNSKKLRVSENKLSKSASAKCKSDAEFDPRCTAFPVATPPKFDSQDVIDNEDDELEDLTLDKVL